MKIKLAIGAAFALALGAAPASAAALSDGGFEVQGPASTGNYCYFGFAAGGNGQCGTGAWAGANGGGFQFEGNVAWPGVATPDGTHYSFIQNLGQISQTFTLSQSGNYLLNWLDAGRPGFGGNQTYRAVIDDGVNPASLLYLGSTTTGQRWTARQAGVAVGLVAGTNYTLKFQGINGAGDNTAFIDAVSLNLITSVVPEPASWMMMLAGFGLAGAAMRRKRGTVSHKKLASL
jgi:PEP-CTERM motif